MSESMLKSLMSKLSLRGRIEKKERLLLDSGDWLRMREMALLGEKRRQELGALFIDNQDEAEMSEGDTHTISFRKKDSSRERGVAVHNHPRRVALFSETDYAAALRNKVDSFPMLNVVNSEGVGFFLGSTKMTPESSLYSLRRDILQGKVELSVDEQLQQLIQWQVVSGQQAGTKFQQWDDECELTELESLSVVKREDALGGKVNWVVYISWEDLNQAIQSDHDLNFRNVAFGNGLPKLLDYFGISGEVPIRSQNLVQALSN